MKKCIRLPKSEYNLVAWCQEPVHFFVESFFFLGSNESIPPPGSLFQQKVIARLYIAKVIAKLEHFDNQERKGKRNVEQKGQLKKQKEKRRNKKRKQRKKKRQIKHGIDGIQNKIRNQS